MAMVSVLEAWPCCVRLCRCVVQCMAVELSCAERVMTIGVCAQSPQCRITKLDLGWNKIGDEGISALCRWLQVKCAVIEHCTATLLMMQ